MKRLLAALAVSLYLASIAFSQTNEIKIIPKPALVENGGAFVGAFEQNRNTPLFFDGETDDLAIVEAFNSVLYSNNGFRLNTRKPKSVNDLNGVFLFGKIKGDTFPTGGYELRVERDRIVILASDSVGRFYALQSLFQIIPSGSRKIVVPGVVVKDQPRFPYRGMHLDVARHFQPVEFVKKYIDLLAQYKFNYFHWHLTDDQGWRIEIKKYPKLTEVGSKRPETHLGAYTTTFKGDGIPVEGFYTQEQIKEVVKYAKERYITVIPEIEMPGHASAALAAYPQFGCKENYNYKVQMTWGIFPEVFCPTDATFKFLEDVLDETIKLFPDSPYIHIGGDEVMKDHWKESAFVQALMKRENLKDEHEVQSYFVHRIEKFVNSRGKKIIGWDEILEGGAAPNATIMSWRGMQGGIDAARAKHDVIMSPTDYSYFDYAQSKDLTKEPVGQSAFLPLEKVYSFDPLPKELNADEAKFILGGQGNVWTEYMKTPAAIEYMVFPRMLALAEALWSTPANKDYADFRRRLAAHLVRLDKQNVKYRTPDPIGKN
jgi:hexosaminidase